MLLSRQSNENITISSFPLNSIDKQSRPAARVLQMAEHYSSTPAVRSWKSLSDQELHQRLTSLGLVLDKEEKASSVRNVNMH